MGRFLTHAAASLLESQGVGGAALQKELPKVSLFDVLVGGGRSMKGSRETWSHTNSKDNIMPDAAPAVRLAKFVLSPMMTNKFSNLYIHADKAKAIKRIEAAQGKPSFTDKKKNGNDTKSANVNNNGKKNDNGKDNGNGKKNGNGNGKIADEKKDVDTKKDGGNQGGDDVAFTAAEDATLLKMKEENKTWREIATEMGKPQGALKHRFKEIKPADGAGGEAKEDGKEAKKKENKKEEAKANEGKKREKAASKEKGKQHAKAPSSHGGGEARFSLGEWMTLQEDELFSFGELQCLSELIARDRDYTWDRVASAFADRTGRRVHEDDIRDKFAELASFT